MTPTENILRYIAEKKEIVNRATEGPWEYVPDPIAAGIKKHVGNCGGFFGKDRTPVCDFGDSETYYPTQGCEPSDQDATFIADSRTTVPALLSALAVAVKALEAVNKDFFGTQFSQKTTLDAINQISQLTKP